MNCEFCKNNRYVKMPMDSWCRGIKSYIPCPRCFDIVRLSASISRVGVQKALQKEVNKRNNES